MKSYTHTKASKRDNLFTALSKVHYLKSGVHGFAGIGILLASMTEVIQFGRTHQANFRTAYLVFVLGIILSLGLLEKQYRLRFQALQKRPRGTTMWIRAIGLELAFCSFPLTWYAHPQEVVPQWINITALIIGISGMVVMLAASLYDAVHLRTDRGTLTATLTASAVLLYVPALHLALGHAAFVELMHITPAISKSFYSSMMVSTMILSWDAFVLGLSTSGHISGDTYHMVAVLDWAVAYTGLIVVFMWRIIHVYAAMATFVVFLACYVASTPLEQWLMATYGRHLLKYSKAKNVSSTKFEFHLMQLYLLGAVGASFAVGWKWAAVRVQLFVAALPLF